MSEKQKYHVTASVTISLHTTVEASSKKEAIELAEDTPITDIIDGEQTGCYSDSHWVTSGELDGEPVGIKAEVAG